MVFWSCFRTAILLISDYHAHRLVILWYLLNMDSLVPRPSHPQSVACSTNVGEGLVKQSHVQWCTWTCGGGHIPGKNASKQVCYRSQTRTIEQLCAQCFLGSERHFTAEAKECATPPHVQVGHCMWLSFTRPSHALVLQAANAGVRRPGYEARIWLRLSYLVHVPN